MNMYKPKSIPEENYFQITTEVLLPILASVIFLITIIAMTCFHFRKKGNLMFKKLFNLKQTFQNS